MVRFHSLSGRGIFVRRIETQVEEDGSQMVQGVFDPPAADLGALSFTVRFPFANWCNDNSRNASQVLAQAQG